MNCNAMQVSFLFLLGMNKEAIVLGEKYLASEAVSSDSKLKILGSIGAACISLNQVPLYLNIWKQHQSLTDSKQPLSLSSVFGSWKYIHLFCLFMKLGQSSRARVMKESDEILKSKCLSTVLRIQFLYLNGMSKWCLLKFNLALSAFRDMIKNFDLKASKTSSFKNKLYLKAMPVISACLIASHRIEQGLHLAREGLNFVEMIGANRHFREFISAIISINTFQLLKDDAYSCIKPYKPKSDMCGQFNTVAALAFLSQINSPHLEAASQMANEGHSI